jgi:hypothetical protein
MKMISPTSTATTKIARLCSMAQPALAVTGAAKANTPMGAISMIQWTNLMSAAERALARESSGSF